MGKNQMKNHAIMIFISSFINMRWKND